MELQKEKSGVTLPLRVVLSSIKNYVQSFLQFLSSKFKEKSDISSVEIFELDFKTLKQIIKDRLSDENVFKVAVADVKMLIESSASDAPFESDLSELLKEGYTHLIASVNSDNQVSDVTALKCCAVDEECEELINRTGEGMVVIER